ncbi:6832_t:CDS:1, partial [Scutellospora calospora]
EKDNQSEISIMPSISASNCDNNNQQLPYNTNKSNQLLLEGIVK